MAQLADAKTIDRLIEKQIALWEAQRKASREAEQRQPETTELRLGPYIAFSREEGSGGGYIAAEVATQLGWELFGRELVERIATRAQYRKTVIDSLDERSRSKVADWVTHLLDRGFVGHHTYVKHLVETLTAVAHYGNVVFIGRGANFVLPRKRGLCVRIIAPLEKRIERVMRDRSINRGEAERFVRQCDADREAFTRMHFHKDVGDPRYYDMVLNTEGIPDKSAADLIIRCLRAKLKSV